MEATLAVAKIEIKASSDKESAAAALEVNRLLKANSASDISHEPTHQLSLSTAITAIIASGTGAAIATGLFSIVRKSRSVEIQIESGDTKVVVSNTTISAGEQTAIRLLKEVLNRDTDA